MPAPTTARAIAVVVQVAPMSGRGAASETSASGPGSTLEGRPRRGKRPGALGNRPASVRA
jgi:hypothetical protein